MSRIEGLDQFLQHMHDYVERTTNELKDAVKETAYKIESGAKQRCPVDTGRLRASISTNIDESASSIKAIVETVVEYARFVEFGTYKQTAQPFLIPSFNQCKSKLIKDIKKIYKEGGS